MLTESNRRQVPPQQSKNHPQGYTPYRYVTTTTKKEGYSHISPLQKYKTKQEQIQPDKDHLNLVFEKQPQEVKQRLMKLLINYNAVMQYNKFDDMFEVDLLLPFQNPLDKEQFIRQFLEARRREEKQKKQMQERSRLASESIHSSQSQSNQQNSKINESSVQQPQPFEQEIKEPEQTPKKLNLNFIESMIDKKLSNAILKINMQKNGESFPPQQQEIIPQIHEQIPIIRYEEDHLQTPQRKDKQSSSYIMPRSNETQSEVYKGSQQILIEDEYQEQSQQGKQYEEQQYGIHIQQSRQDNQQEQNDLFDHRELQNYRRNHKPSYERISEANEQYESEEEEVKKKKNPNQIKKTTFQDYQKMYIENKEKKFKNSTKSGNGIQKQKNKEKISYMPIRNVTKPQPKPKSPTRKTNFFNQINFINPSSSKKSKQRFPQSYQAKYKNFVDQHRKNLENFYETIRKDIKIMNKSNSQKQQLIKEQDIAYEEQQLSQKDSSEQEAKQFKEQIIKDLRQRIFVNNETLSSEDLVRYFRYLHVNARKLYLKYIKSEKSVKK